MPQESGGPVRDEVLLDRAREAASSAYCPYSGFRVGAAVLAGDVVYTGCNVENASYGLTICAERVALFSAVAAGARNLQRLVVATPDAPAAVEPRLKMPCGACRQVMAELMSAGAAVVVEGVGEFTVEDLLPNAFRLGAPRPRRPDAG